MRSKRVTAAQVAEVHSAADCAPSLSCSTPISCATLNMTCRGVVKNTRHTSARRHTRHAIVTDTSASLCGCAYLAKSIEVHSMFIKRTSAAAQRQRKRLLEHSPGRRQFCKCLAMPQKCSKTGERNALGSDVLFLDLLNSKQMRPLAVSNCYKTGVQRRYTVPQCHTAMASGCGAAAHDAIFKGRYTQRRVIQPRHMRSHHGHRQAGDVHRPGLLPCAIHPAGRGCLHRRSICRRIVCTVNGVGRHRGDCSQLFDPLPHLRNTPMRLNSDSVDLVEHCDLSFEWMLQTWGRVVTRRAMSRRGKRIL